MRMTTLRKDKKGFTLIELIVVIALLAIIAVLAIPQFNKVKDESAKNIAIANARTVYTAGLTTTALEGDAAAEVTVTNGSTSDTGDFAATFKDFLSSVNGTCKWSNAGKATWTGSVNGKNYTCTYDSNGAGTPTTNTP